MFLISTECIIYKKDRLFNLKYFEESKSLLMLVKLFVYINYKEQHNYCQFKIFKILSISENIFTCVWKSVIYSLWLWLFLLERVHPYVYGTYCLYLNNHTN